MNIETMPEMSEAKPKNIQELLVEYDERVELEGRPKPELLIFDISDQDFLHSLTAPFRKTRHANEETIAAEITIYNPSPVKTKEQTVISARVEPRSSERQSQVMFFEEKDGVWKLIKDAPILPLQDPFYEPDVDGSQIFGGVKTHPDKTHPGVLCYETAFYRFQDDIHEIHDPPFAIGPERMKDIRLIQIAPGRIGVFTRPQGGEAGRGKIGYLEIRHLSELEEKIPQAQLIEGMFAADEWGGANDLELLKDGRVGVLGHIAYEKETKKFYYPTAFIFNPESRLPSDLKILATARDLEKIEPKNPHQGEILYPGGLQRREDGAAILYAGYNDVRAVRLELKDPFPPR